MTMCVSALGLTTLDSVARIGRMSLQELLYDDDGKAHTPVTKFLTNKYVATVVTLIFGFLLALGGYNNIWPLFGSSCLPRWCSLRSRCFCAQPAAPAGCCTRR